MKIRFSVSMEEELVALVDAEIGKRKGFENRSQGISYCVRVILELEKYANGSVKTMMDFLDLIENHPGIGGEFLALLDEEKRRRGENWVGR
jgi:metal-responsive CopG/Arc/MetJ family transcriptional regulator